MADYSNFSHDDTGYQSWVRSNPRGFVLNCLRSPNLSDSRLHRADCHTVSGFPANGKTWTSGDYIKVCSGSATALQTWHRTRVGQDAQRCGVCQP